MNFKLYWDVIKQIVDEFSENKVPKLGAALAYYTVFSLAPLLLIAIAVAGLIFGSDAASGRIYDEVKGLIGGQGAELLQTAIKNSSNKSAGILAAILSLITLGIGATAVFIELQDSLDMIWKVKPKSNKPIISFVRTRLISFALVVGMGFLLLVSLVISAALTALNQFLTNLAFIPLWVLQIFNIVFSLFVIFILFSMIYKILPDVKLSWKDVRIGAIVTTLLFVAGKYLIGLYLGKSTISSTYGAAGSFAVLLVWVYYSSQILFIGAVFTYVYATRFGSGVNPTEHADKLEAGKFEELSKNK
ncbi:MAG: YihY/virulence factor BrkB family protein [Bacteroidota bacterium]|nr:YihY/virulence factor BrkB family protein [Bacteroidota bacterium]MDP4196389.1 YihY/virulence factor BrkB family protein [Bacteroidota bacterium]